MFEEYLQDAYQFYVIALKHHKAGEAREARRYYRAAVFYAAGAIEAFVNYVADSFEKAKSLPDYEISFLNDKVKVFTVDKGLWERVEYHRLDDKLKLLLNRFDPEFDYQSAAWNHFMEFKVFRDSLVHPRSADDPNSLEDYEKKIVRSLRAVIEVMNSATKAMHGKPLRKQILDLIPD